MQRETGQFMGGFGRFLLFALFACIVSAAANAAPTADSVTPNAGSGTTQSFAFKYSSPNGFGYLASMYALVNGSLSPVSGCLAYYLPGSNALYLFTDSGSAVTGPVSPGGTGTLSNSQCTINAAGSSAVGAGNTLTLTLAIAFTQFPGTKTLFGYATDNGNLSSGWQNLGTWTTLAWANVPPTADSVTPNAGAGTTQSFAFKYSSVNGFGFLSAVYALFNGSLSAANGCMAYYLPGSNALYLFNDAGSALTGPVSPGGTGTLSNSQCTINAAGSSAAGAGNTLTLTLAITFNAGFSATQTLFGYAVDNNSLGSGWQNLGTWRTAAYVNVAPTADSVAPNAGSGASHNFAFKYSSVNGYGYLASMYALVNGSLSAANGCVAYYAASGNLLYLFNDAGNAVTGPVSPGGTGTLSNSQCTINAAGSSAGGALNTLTLTLAITFKTGFIGTQTLFGYAADNGNRNSGWQNLGTWTTQSFANVPPTTDSVTPNAGAGTTQNFAFKYSSVNGFGYLTTVYAYINGLGVQIYQPNTYLRNINGCSTFYLPGSNLLYLYDDGGGGSIAPLSLGGGGTLSNSQCTINVAGSSAVGAGNTLTLTLAIAFKTGFSGEQSVWGYALDKANLTSEWQNLGTWTTLTLPNLAPTADSVTPGAGSGASQTFTFKYSMSATGSHLSRVSGLINSSVSYAGGCFFQMDYQSLYLYNDAGTATTGVSLNPGGQGNSVSNSQCTISDSGFTISQNGSQVIYTIPIAFNNSFAGAKNVYGYASDEANRHSGWQALGTWTVTGPPAPVRK